MWYRLHFAGSVHWYQLSVGIGLYRDYTKVFSINTPDYSRAASNVPPFHKISAKRY